LKESFFLDLDRGVTLLDHITDLHGPHLLAKRLLNVFILVLEAVLIEQLLVLDGHLQLLKQFVLGYIAGNLNEFSDFDELLLILRRLFNRLLHHFEGVLDVIHSVIAPLFDGLNHTVAQFKSCLGQNVLQFLGLDTEHRCVNVVVRQIHYLIGCLMVQLDSSAYSLNVSLGTTRSLKQLFVVKQVFNQLFLVYIQKVLVLFILCQDLHRLFYILLKHHFDPVTGILDPGECLIDGEVRLGHSHK
jgi:hypothetical protein